MRKIVEERRWKNNRIDNKIKIRNIKKKQKIRQKRENYEKIYERFQVFFEYFELFFLFFTMQLCFVFQSVSVSSSDRLRSVLDHDSISALKNDIFAFYIKLQALL